MIAMALALTVVIAGGLGTLPGSALAGSYVVTACSPSSSPGLWAQTNTFPAALATGNRCGGPEVGPTDGSHQGALYAEDVLNSPANIPDGSRAGWSLTAPAGATIIAISYYRLLTAYNDQDIVSGLFTADGAALEQCKIPWPFPSGSSIHCDRINNQAPVTFSGLSTSSLFVGVICRIVTGALACNGGGAPLHAATADLYSARVTLSESTMPTLSNVGGALWDGGVVSGVVAVSFAASDATGIKEQVVRSAAGGTLASASAACDSSLAQPCPQLPAGSLSVDTTRVPDGSQAFSLVVTDAAGNTQVATSPPVLVDNNGPPAPAALTATAQNDQSNVIAVAWRDPSNPPAPVSRAMVQLCQATCLAATGISASGAARVTAPGPGDYGVRLWLIDVHGRGGPQNAALASVTVPSSAATPQTGSRATVAAVLTGRRLRVSATIGRDQRVRVSWRSSVAGRTVGHGSRVVTARDQRIALTFTPSRRSRSRSATIRIAVRSGSRIIAQARARRG